MFAVIISILVAVTVGVFVNDSKVKRWTTTITAVVFVLSSVGTLVYGYNHVDRSLVEFGYIDAQTAYASGVAGSTATVTYVESDGDQSYYVVVEKSRPWWVSFAPVVDMFYSDSDHKVALTEKYIYLAQVQS